MQQNNQLFDKLKQVVTSELVDSNINLKPWTPAIAESFHNLSPRTLIEDEYFLNAKNTCYPFHMETIEELYKEKNERKIDLVVLMEGVGAGKSLSLDSKILTPDGWKLNSDLVMGDIVITEQGEFARIIGIYDQPVMDIYRVTFSDGAYVDCSGDHLWHTYTLQERKGISRYKTGVRIASPSKGAIRTTVEIKNSLFYERKKRDSLKNHSIPITKPIKFSNKQVSLSPYVMGALLGDGHFIPQEYLFNIVDNRIALLQGLIDTDGYITKRGSVYYTTTSKQLADDVVFLVQSLGGICKIKEKLKKYIYKGEQKIGRLAYSICIKLPPDIVPVRLDRKKERYKPKTKYLPTRFIISVDWIKRDRTRCISIDSPSGLYLTNDCIVTHNTHLASILEWIEWFQFTTVPDPVTAFPYIDVKNSTTAFILMSRDKEKARKVVFTNVFQRFQSQFNKEYFPPNPNIKTYLDIPRNHTLIFPGTGEAVSALGFNVFSGVVDEGAFLQQVSKESSSEEVGDQAQAMYEQIHGRIWSRFGDNGGMVIFISSARKADNWMESKIMDAIKFGDRKDKVFWRRAPFWAAKPKGFFESGRLFLFNAVTMEIETDEDRVKEYMLAKQDLKIDTKYNPVLRGLLL